MKKTIILLILASIFFSSCSKQEEKIQKYYKTEKVQTGTLNTNSSFVGYIEGKDSVGLATKSPGRVINIYVKQGDLVQKGQLLLELDGAEAKVGYSTASDIEYTLVDMKKQTALMFDNQIKAVEEKIKQAQSGVKGVSIGLEDTKNITQNQLKAAKAQEQQAFVGLQTAKTNLEQTKNVLETKEKHIYKNTISAITNSVILDSNILDFIDSLIGATEENRTKNDSFETYLSAKKPQDLKDAKKDFLRINNLFLEYKNLYEQNIENKNPSNQTIKEISQKGIILAEEIKSLLNITYDILDNSIANTMLPQATIDSYKAKVSQMGKDIEASLLTVSGDYILGLKGSIENMESFDSESKMQISLLEKQVELAEKSLEAAQSQVKQYEAMASGQINEVETKKEISQLGLEEAKAQLEALKKQKQTSLREIDAKIAETKGQKNSAGVMIQNAKIYAPVSGVITRKNVEVGQVVAPGMPLISISNPEELKIKIGVDDETLQNIKIGDFAIIEVENVERQLKGIVQNIYPSKDPITKKNTVEIFMQEDKVKLGAMAKVYFENKNQKIYTIIPNSAILEKFMLPGVYVINGGKAQFKNIEILKQSDNFSAIRGLKIGKKVITKGKENIFDGEELN